MNKIESNIIRDKVVNTKLNEEGWVVLRYWGKQIRKNLDGCVAEIENTFRQVNSTQMEK